MARGVAKIYGSSRAKPDGEWRIVRTSPTVVIIESHVRDPDWSELGVIRCDLDRASRSVDRWFQSIGWLGRLSSATVHAIAVCFDCTRTRPSNFHTMPRGDPAEQRRWSLPCGNTAGQLCL